MRTDTEIRSQGFQALEKSLGSVEAERFVALILREPFDYTQWRKCLFEGQTVEEVSEAASRFRKESKS